MLIRYSFAGQGNLFHNLIAGRDQWGLRFETHCPRTPWPEPGPARENESQFAHLHPSPVDRGVEIDSDIADSNRSLILEQVTNGIAVRMAVLFLVNGGKGPQEVAAG